MRARVAGLLSWIVATVSLCACSSGFVPPDILRSPRGGGFQVTPVSAMITDCREPRTARTPTKIRIQYFGTSTLFISDGVTHLMVDAFLTRPSKAALLGPVEPDVAKISRVLRTAGIGCLDAILVSHSHFDHALDSGAAALITGAAIHGSTSTENLLYGQGFGDARFERLDVSREFAVGAFSVQAIPTPHSEREFARGDIQAPPTRPIYAWDMRTGASYSFRISHPSAIVLVVPGARVDMEEQVAMKCADVTFLGIARLGMQSKADTRTLWDRWVTHPHASLVGPVHWDDFSQPLAPTLEPLPFPIDRMDVTSERLEKLARHDDVGVVFLRPFRVYELVSSSEKTGCR